MDVFLGKPRIRLGIWGLGRGLHIASVAQALHLDVVAGCDFNPHFVEHFRRQIPEGRVTSDPAEFLGWDLDAVLVATFCPDHAEHAIRCLEAGRHVLSEVTAFHTPGQGVRLVEAVLRSGRVYQLAENYPAMPANRYLARRWREGLFGELQYAEYSYIHDCLHLAYTYIDGAPVEPGSSLHAWRSWLPWHFYCTHSLGPVMTITGLRPEKVVTLPGSVRLPGHVMDPPSGLGGMAPSLIRMSNGALVRNLMGGCTNDQDFRLLYGTRGSSEWTYGKLRLRLGGRGHTPVVAVDPEEDELGRLAASTGHGGGDFWTLYHFADEILNGAKPPFDVFAAADVTLPGILAYRSALAGGAPQDVPDFRKPAERDRWRGDESEPPRYPVCTGLFPGRAGGAGEPGFTALMKRLLHHADAWQSFHDFARVAGDLESADVLHRTVAQVRRELDDAREAVREARRMIADNPGSDGARVLEETLGRFAGTDPLDPGAAGAVDAVLAGALAARAARMERVRAETPGQIWPQLRMLRPGLGDLPAVSLPDGYTLRHFRPGDEHAWIRIVDLAFGGARTVAEFEASMGRLGELDPRRILFVCAPDGVPVATASAYGDAVEGYVHFVALDPAHAGKELGLQASLAVLHAFRERGCVRAVLDTDDFRTAALKVYLKLGFRPLLTDDGHAARWRRLALRLGRPALLDSVALRPLA